jgi:molybdate transport system ATP-binding protein
VNGLESHVVVRRNGFSLDARMVVRPGSTVGLLGPNGAGKSSVVAAIAGLLPIDDGSIELDGTVLDRPGHGIFVPARDRGVGVVFQDNLLFPHMSVADNVAFGLQSRGDRHAMERAGAMLERLGIDKLAARSPRDLSGGQAQRVALARALITEPRLLLLDEPMSALDVTARAHLRRLLGDHLAQFAGPRLLITHDPTEAFLLADEIYVIEDGKITQTGTPDEIRLRPRTRYIADLAGSNLLAGVARNGVVSLDHDRLTIADTQIDGDVHVIIHPRAIALHRSQPGGSPRNTWQTVIDRLEHYGDRVRIQTGAPIPLTAEVTPGAIDALAIGVESSVWVSIKATEINTIAR